jgi:hypothetical protein
MAFDIFLSAATSPRDDVLLATGWSSPEREGRWAVGHSSTVILPPFRATQRHRLAARVLPMIIENRIARQGLTVILNGSDLGTVELTEPGHFVDLFFDIPPGLLHADGTNILRFEHPDAAAPSEYGTSTDARELSLMFNWLQIGYEGSPIPLPSSRPLFIILGVCLPHQRPNLGLIDFLYSEECDILFWLDCWEAADFIAVRGSVEVAYPRVIVAPAPRALWGGPSIVQSMIRALGYATRNIPNWTMAFFTSTVDVPLIPRARLFLEVSKLRTADFCGSQWTSRTEDVLRPNEFMVRQSTETPSYLYYPYREDTHLRIETSLAQICPEDLINNKRITKTLAERYYFYVTENFSNCTVSFHQLTPNRARERADFFERFSLITGRMWVCCSRRFAAILSGDEVSDWFWRGFYDIFIADECFFQSVAQNYAQRDAISVLWRSLYYDGANPIGIDDERYRILLAMPYKGELFARKAAGLERYDLYLESSNT